ncbi:hypothetical protein KFE25_012012 [Diacronema lutheri]|uniref:Uncharacterized protein n=1 Tax=Diacronema lutheri TaxID=2081491 RepID=A0A8J5X0X0_DIALT|nr:hypothetical protein KFE25_012012 [Diacronema lutheri]
MAGRRGAWALLVAVGVRGAGARGAAHPVCAHALACASDRLTELSATLLDDAAAAELAVPAGSFRARADGVRAACVAEFERACAARVAAGGARATLWARLAASHELAARTADALEPAVRAQLAVLADAAADDFDAAQLRVVPGTEAYAGELLRARRSAQRAFARAARGCVPRALRAPRLRSAVRRAAADVDARLGAEAERLVRLSPAMTPPVEMVVEKWYRRLAWQLLAIAINLAQAQAQDWWGRRAQRRALARGGGGGGSVGDGGGGRSARGAVRGAGTAPSGPAF